MPEQAIEVIPVIDLKGGAAVRARQGLRHSYLPLITPFAPTGAPLEVAAGLLAIHPFEVIYVADLDRITQCGSHDLCLNALTAAFPSVTFWVDAGVRHAGEARAWLAQHQRAHLVLGSESLQTHTVLEELAGCERIVLSLDYRGGSFLGPEGLCCRPELWPARVIVMSLARVGSGAGPDMSRLAKIKRLAPDAMLFAAGGLRGARDLVKLKQAGIRGVLVASALHDGHLTSGDFALASKELA
jgi:phosphoribosylformimino-5-aminoimidazole carboxamide ribotide isomerase